MLRAESGTLPPQPALGWGGVGAGQGGERCHKPLGPGWKEGTVIAGNLGPSRSPGLLILREERASNYSSVTQKPSEQPRQRTAERGHQQTGSHTQTDSHKGMHAKAHPNLTTGIKKRELLRRRSYMYSHSHRPAH